MRNALTLPTVCLLVALSQGCSQDGSACGDAATPGALPAVSRAVNDSEVPAALQRTTTSGFLRDYTMLTSNPIHKGSLIYRSDKFGSYSKFLIDTPQFLPTVTVRGVAINSSSAAQLASDLKAAASDALGINFTVTDRPGEGVARIRLAITQIAESDHEANATMSKVGGASVEMEIIDSITGELIAAATESDAVTTLDPDFRATSPYYDARLVFQHWAARLSKALTDARP